MSSRTFRRKKDLVANLEETPRISRRLLRSLVVAFSTAIFAFLLWKSINLQSIARNIQSDDRLIVEMLKKDGIRGKMFPTLSESSKLYPYYHKATEMFQESTVTLCTHMDINRLKSLERLAKSWDSPLSVLVHLSPDDTIGQRTLNSMLHDENVKKWADVHLLVDGFDRQFNLWRNMARIFARTRYVLQLDADFDASRNILSEKSLLQRLDSEKIILVLPALEHVPNTQQIGSKEIPKTKKDVLKAGKMVQTFHPEWPRGHAPTDYQKWIQAKTPYAVKDYNYHYEPYIIMAKTGPPYCDERFIGYGSNKAACIFATWLEGYKFLVVPDDFVFHVDHPYSIQRGLERKLNRRLFEVFRDEACLFQNRRLQPEALTNDTLQDLKKCIKYGRSTLSEGMITWNPRIDQEAVVKLETDVGGSMIP